MSLRYYSFVLITGFILIIVGLMVLILPQTGKVKTDHYTNIENRFQQELDRADDALKDLSRKISSTSIVDIDLSEEGYPYNVYIYRNQNIVNWSDNSVVPSFKEIASINTIFLYQNYGWKCILKRLEVRFQEESEPIILAVLIPLQYIPTITNKYLRTTWNDRIFENSQFDVGAINEEDFTNIMHAGKSLFSVQLGDNYAAELISLKYIALILISLGMVLLGFSLSNSIHRLIIRKKRIIAALWFAAFWILVFSIFKITGPLNLWQGIPLLDTRIYASSWILNNLLDLILFSLFLLSIAMMLIRLVYTWSFIKWTIRLSTPSRMIIGSLFVLLLLYTLTLHFLIFRDIYDNSRISLDVNHSLALSWERIACLSVFLINAFCVFYLFHLFLKSWILTCSANIRQLIITFLIGVVAFISIQNKFPLIFIISIMVGYLLLLGTSRVYLNFGRFNYLSLLYLAGSLILSSIISAYSITQMEQKRDVEDIRRFGNEQLLDADIFGEFLMDETVRNVKDDPFIGNWMTSPFVSKDIITRKINQKYIDPYLDRYDVQIFLYNQNGRPLSTNANALNYQIVYDRITVVENSTDFENIYRAKDFQYNMFKEYYAFIEVERLGSRVGYILIDFNQKRAIPNNVYPELLVDSRVVQPPGDLDVSYAVYSGSNLLNNVGDFKTWTPAWARISLAGSSMARRFP